MLVHGIAVRPGHPVIIGMIAKTPVIGVPGYPVSAALTGELLILPQIRRWQGLPDADVATVEAVSTRKIVSPIGDDDFVRVALAAIDGQLPGDAAAAWRRRDHIAGAGGWSGAYTALSTKASTAGQR